MIIVVSVCLLRIVKRARVEKKFLSSFIFSSPDGTLFQIISCTSIEHSHTLICYIYV